MEFYEKKFYLKYCEHLYIFIELLGDFQSFNKNPQVSKIEQNYKNLTI